MHTFQWLPLDLKKQKNWSALHISLAPAWQTLGSLKWSCSQHLVMSENTIIRNELYWNDEVSNVKMWHNLVKARQQLCKLYRPVLLWRSITHWRDAWCSVQLWHASAGTLIYPLRYSVGMAIQHQQHLYGDSQLNSAALLTFPNLLCSGKDCQLSGVSFPSATEAVSLLSAAVPPERKCWLNIC